MLLCVKLEEMPFWGHFLPTHRKRKLDDTGYSGHLSYILFMLDNPAFLTPYLAGDHRPEAVMAFGRTHGIMINRVAVQRADGAGGERMREGRGED
jgi:hypothetical protein